MKNYNLHIIKATQLFIVVALLLCKVSLSQTASDSGAFSFSLQQAVDYALKNQVQVQNAAYDEEIAKQKVKEIIGIGLPQIGSSISVQDFLKVPTSVIPARAFNPFASEDEYVAVQFGIQYSATASIEASQLVFSSDYLVGLQASKTYLELSRKAAQRTRIETTVTVTKAYYTALLNDERMKLIDANIVRLKKLMDDTKVLNENGLVEKIDLDRITLAYNNLTTEKDKVRKMVDLGNSLLKFQLGMKQSSTLTLTDNLTGIQFSPEMSPDKFDYGKRIEHGLLQTQRNASKLLLKQSRLKYLPTAALFGNVSANAFSNKFDFFDFKKAWYPTILIGGKISLPITDGFQTHHKTQQAKLEVLKVENNLKMLEQSIDLELSSAKTNLLNATSTLDMQKKNIELAEGIYKLAKIKYGEGVGSNLEVMDAETSLKEAQTNYFGALFDALISKVDYEKASGNIK